MRSTVPQIARFGSKFLQRQITNQIYTAVCGAHLPKQALSKVLSVLKDRSFGGSPDSRKENKPHICIMSLTEDCCKPAPPAVDNSVGKDEIVAGLPAYVTGSPSASAAVLFISDLFGFQAPLLRRLADKVAKAGYFVVVPDFFKGDPFIAATGPNVLEGIDKWLPVHMPNGAVPDVKSLVEYFHAKGISSLGASGFCWGAKVVALTAKDDSFKAVVQLHPSLPEASDYEEVKPPIAVLASPTDQAEELAAPILGARHDIKSFVKVFPSVYHGWTIRYDENNLELVANAEEAHKDMLDWYAKYLPATETATSTATNLVQTVKELPAKLMG